MRGNLFPTEDSSDGSFVGLANNARRILSCGEGIPSSSILSATHASSSPDSTSYPSKDPDANRDLAMRQMADVIKSVEARIKQIQVKRNPQVQSNPVTMKCAKTLRFVG